MLFFTASCMNQSFFSGSGQEAFHGSRLLQASQTEGAIPKGLSLQDRQTEHFVLDGGKALIDLLIVVDTSRSMFHHLNDLGESLGEILTLIPDYDWQIAFSSADHGDHSQPKAGLQAKWRSHTDASLGRFGSLMPLEDEGGILRRRILNKDIPDYRNVFFYTLSHTEPRNCRRPPYCHGRVEQPLRSLKSAMQRAVLDNGALFRPRADFVSLIVTNEEERAEDRSRATSAEELVETFHRVFGHLDKKFIAFNILVLDEDCLEREREAGSTAHIAKSIARLADLTGGENISICQSSYGPDLKSISQKIKSSLENSVALAMEPLPETLEVAFEGPHARYELYGRQMVFERASSQPLSFSVSYYPKNLNKNQP